MWPQFHWELFRGWVLTENSHGGWVHLSVSSQHQETAKSWPQIRKFRNGATIFDLILQKSSAIFLFGP